jgi:hypothetical protein
MFMCFRCMCEGGVAILRSFIGRKPTAFEHVRLRHPKTSQRCFEAFNALRFHMLLEPEVLELQR